MTYNSTTPIKDMISSFLDTFGFPIITVLAVITFVGIIIAPIEYVERQNQLKPITMRKCEDIKKTIDEKASYSSSLEMCLSRNEDGKLYSYTVINKKVNREEVKL